MHDAEREPIQRMRRVETIRTMLLGAVALFAVGCGSKPVETPPAKVESTATQKEEPEAAVGDINVGPGKSTDRSPDGKREKIWDLDWQEARVNPQTKTVQAQSVKGVVYREGKAVANYNGQAGAANQAKETLILKGNVQVKSLSREATLFCDELLYEGKQGGKGRIRARGNVRVEAKDGNLSSSTEIWATPDLTQIATPELFGKL